MEEYLQLLDETGEARRDSGASDRMQQNTPAAASAGVEEQYSIDPDFDREIVAWDEGGRNDSRIFRLGSTSEALQSIGVQERDIVMASGKINRILREHPNMTMDMVRQIPAMLEDPALVLESQGRSMRRTTEQNSRIVVVGTVTDANGAPVLCVLDLQPQSTQDRRLGLQDFNKVSSAYPKDVNPKGFLRSSNVLYANPDINKTQAALNSFGFKLASSELNHLGSMGSIAHMKGAASRYRACRLEKCLSREGRLPPRRRAKPKATQVQQQTDRKLTVSRGNNHLGGFAKHLQTVRAGK